MSLRDIQGHRLMLAEQYGLFPYIYTLFHSYIHTYIDTHDIHSAWNAWVLCWVLVKNISGGSYIILWILLPRSSSTWSIYGQYVCAGFMSLPLLSVLTPFSLMLLKPYSASFLNLGFFPLVFLAFIKAPPHFIGIFLLQSVLERLELYSLSHIHRFQTHPTQWERLP